MTIYSWPSAGFYASRVLTRNYDASSGTGGTYGSYTPGFFKGRYVGYDLGIAGNPTRDQHIAYTASNLGRFVGVNTRTTAGTARDYIYSYYSSSSLIGGYGMGSSFTVSRSYETQRNVLTKIDSQWNSASVARYDYTTNALGRRTTAKQSGAAFADYSVAGAVGYSATYNTYAYNARGELQTTARYRGDMPKLSPASTDELPAQRFEYRYDSIGNRTTSGSTGTAADDSYTVNALNQYVARDNKKVKVLGTANAKSTVSVAGASSTGKTDNTWGADLTPANSSGPAQAAVTVTAVLAGAGPGGTDLVRTDSSRIYFVPKLAQALSYDADGNLTGDGVWTYTYNAENQLVRMNSLLDASFTGMDLRIDFKYDYQGRRVEKMVFDYPTSTQTLDRRFLYDGPNLIAETDASGNLQRTFTWGLDLAGSLSATGGVGALLQIDDIVGGKVLSATYDGNGNIATLVNAVSGGVEAAYEYDPSGNLLRCEGAYAKNNPFRFSTKWQDDETGLINYGHRYYSPSLGRFINRDPIAEQGGLNLYGFCGNDAINGIDVLGHGNFFSDIGHALSKAWKAIKPVVGIVVGIVVAIYAPELLGVTSNFWGAVVGGAAGGFAGGFTGTAVNGGSFRQALGAGLMGAAIGGIMGGIGYDLSKVTLPSNQFASSSVTANLYTDMSRVIAAQGANATRSLVSGIAGGVLGTGLSVREFLSAAGSGAAHGLYNVTAGAAVSAFNSGVNHMAASAMAFGEGDYTMGVLHATAMAGDVAGLALTAVGAGQALAAGGRFAVSAGVRALRLPAVDAELLGTRTLGYTTPNGQVFLRPGLSRAEQIATLRHESVHAFFSPRGNGTVAQLRQSFGQWAYDNSQLARFTEEAMAETYASGSLLQGLSHPLVNGYGITAGGLLLEGGAYGATVGGAGYFGYQLGGGDW